MTKLVLPKPQNADRLLESVALLADELDRRIAFGTGTLTWPGGSANSTGVTITHGLEYVPIAVLITPGPTFSGLNLIPACALSSLAATNFQAFAATIDGQTPALGSSCSFSWWAVR